MSSPKHKIVLSDEAQEDFRDILSFTTQMWSEQQADIYSDIINDALALLAVNPKMGHKKLGIQKDILALKVKRHFIFYQLEDDTIYILRILHDSMDYIMHLQ
jgi:toxin ParE1/3/4